MINRLYWELDPALEALIKEQRQRSKHVTETEKHINRIENLFSYITAAERDSLTAAIEALRACENIRALCETEHEAGDSRLDIELVEGLLP